MLDKFLDLIQEATKHLHLAAFMGLTLNTREKKKDNFDFGEIGDNVPHIFILNGGRKG